MKPLVLTVFVGQRECCECPRPRWEHLYDPPYGTSPTLFFVKEYIHELGWHWAPVGGLIRQVRAS